MTADAADPRAALVAEALATHHWAVGPYRWCECGVIAYNIRAALADHAAEGGDRG